MSSACCRARSPWGPMCTPRPLRIRQCRPPLSSPTPSYTEALLCPFEPRARGDAYMNLEERCQQVELILSDVDGVLTDGGIVFNNQGIESKQFHVRDGLGI